jgi:hypothetical protein
MGDRRLAVKPRNNNWLLNRMSKTRADKSKKFATAHANLRSKQNQPAPRRWLILFADSGRRF